MLRKIRIALAIIFFLAITAIFVDPTGTVQRWFGFTAKLQFLPAVLAVNIVVIAVTLLVALLFGRVYCSVVCPLGVTQDIISHISGMRKKKKARFHSAKELKWLRYGVWVLFVAAFVAGLQWLVAILAPYSAYGRIIRSALHPEIPVVIVAAVTLIVIAILSWTGGRTYCNSICPVGTTLSFFSRFAAFRPVIDADKCRNCHLCEKKCKAQCIDIASHKIDYSRCVDCFNCLDNCKFDALKYRFAWKRSTPGGEKAPEGSAQSRRAFLAGTALAVGSVALKAQDKKLDGGFADILPKQDPPRTTPLTPFGSLGVKEFYSKCTACQLCVSNCPNGVLRPSTSFEHFMQPEMSYTDGYCRPECTVCSEVCPAGAILPIAAAEKIFFHIGTASVDRSLCVVETQGVSCGNCARHCPAEAILMVPLNPGDPESLKIPAVNETLCIGCGACENLCPSRPISAIRVEGLSVHHKD